MTKNYYRDNLPIATKKHVAGRQHFRCANKPNVTLIGLEKYNCPFWCSTEHEGSFDQSGYDIDHVTEYCLTKDHHVDNLQALCKCCHSVKTKNFMRNKNTIKTKYVAEVKDEPVDVYKQFLDECTEYKKGNRITGIKLYQIFKIWWKNTFKTDPIGKNTFLKKIYIFIDYKKIRLDNGTAYGANNLTFK